MSNCISRMKKFFVVSSAMFAVTLSSAQTGDHNMMKSLPPDNPFSKASTLLYEAPPFDKIKDSDYKPALEEGINDQQEEIKKIADNPAAPTFENTVDAMEKTGQLLNRVNNVFNCVTGANTNKTLQALKEEIAPKLAANRDAIYLNTKLFDRIQTLYNDREKLNLNAESKRLLEYDYQQFVLAGAKLSDADKANLKKLNQEEATLSAKFTNQLLNAAKAGAVLI